MRHTHFLIALLLALLAVPGLRAAEDPKLDLSSVVDEKSEAIKAEQAEAGEGDKAAFTIRTDVNIATIEVGDVYRSEDKSFFKVSGISSKGADGGAFTVERTHGKTPPGMRLQRVQGQGPMTVTIRQTLLDMYWAGGFALHPIALLGIITLILTFNGMLLYTRKRQLPADFIAAAEKALRKGNLSKFEELALETRGLVAHIARAMVDRFDTSTIEDIKERSSIAAASQINRLRLPIKALNLISVAAPLLGLLGTIVGMVIVFEAVANVTGAAKGQQLAAGIRVKLFSTAFALCVALPSLFVYFWFNSKLGNLIAECEEVSERFLHRLSVLKREGAVIGEAAAEEEQDEEAVIEEEQDEDDEEEEAKPAPKARPAPRKIARGEA